MIKRLTLLAFALAALVLASCGSSPATSSATTRTPAAATRCFGREARNEIEQCGLFRWAGAGFDTDWIWQRPRNPHWPNVAIVANLAYANGPHARDFGDNDCDNDSPAKGITARGPNWKGWPADPTAPGSLLEPRASIELTDYRIVYQLGDFGNATPDLLVAHIRGAVWSDVPIEVGLHMPGKASQIDGGTTDSNGNVYNPSGVILDGMVGPASSHCKDRKDRKDCKTNKPAPDSFNVKFAMSDGVSHGGGYFEPSDYSGMTATSVPNALFWTCGVDYEPTFTWGGPIKYDLDWTVTLQPEADQTAGTYRFDPDIVVRPISAGLQH